MAFFQALDWGHIFVPDTPLLEIFLRGSIVYLFIFVLLRVLVRRQAGSLTMSDLLVTVLIADAAQNAMADDYQSIPDGLFLVATLIFWNMVLDWLSFRYPSVQKLIHPKALPIVKNGAPLRQNMRKEMISYEELMSRIREDGLTEIKDVAEAYVEGNGHISVIPKKKG